MHLDINKLDPTPTTDFGRYLLQNGYFLAAYALYLSRMRKSKTLLQYFAKLYAKFKVIIGKQEMKFHLKTR